MKKPKNKTKISRHSIRPSEEAYSAAMVTQIGDSGTIEAYDKMHHHHHHHHHHKKVEYSGKAKWQPVRKGNATLIADPLKEQDSDSSSSSSSDEGSSISGSAHGTGRYSAVSSSSNAQRGKSRKQRGSVVHKKEDGSYDIRATAKETFRLAIKSMLPTRAKVRFQKVEKDHLPWFVPPLYSYEEDESLFGDGGDIDKHYYSLNFVQRFFVMLEQPNSCKLSVAVNWLIMLVTLLSVGIYIISTIPEVRSTPSTCDSPACSDDAALCPGEEICAPEPPSEFDPIEQICLYVFVIDYFTRFLLCTTVPPRLAGIDPLNLPSASDKTCLESIQRCTGCRGEGHSEVHELHHDEGLFNDKAALEYDSASDASEERTVLESSRGARYSDDVDMSPSLTSSRRGRKGPPVPPLTLPIRAGRFGTGVDVTYGDLGGGGGGGRGDAPPTDSTVSSPSHFDAEDFISTPGTSYSQKLRSPGASGGNITTGGFPDIVEEEEEDGLMARGSSTSGKHGGGGEPHHHHHHHHKHPHTPHGAGARGGQVGSPSLTTHSGSIKSKHILALKAKGKFGSGDGQEDAEEIILMDKALARKIQKASTLGGFKIPPLRTLPITLAQLGHYILQWMNIVDLIAIIPFFLQISGGSASGSTLSIVRVLRLARILRVLKLGKGSKGLQVLLATMVSSLPALVILGFFSMIGFILMGSLEYFFEGGDFKVTELYPEGAYMISDVTGTNEVKSKYESIPISMYWSIITSTGVGFGDIYPVTYYGRGIAVLAMYGGILVLALPISVIGNNFERLYDQSLGHLSYGVVNAILELMEDEDHEDEYINSREAYYKLALHDRELMGDKGVSDEGVFRSRRELLEKRASKLASVFVIAQVCLKEGDADDINRLLVKVGLRDMIAALEYVYDLDFRHQQLEDFVLHAVAAKQKQDLLEEAETVKMTKTNKTRDLLFDNPSGSAAGSGGDEEKEKDKEDPQDHDSDHGRAVADRLSHRVGRSVKSSSIVHGSIKAGSPRNDDSSDDDDDDDDDDDENSSKESGLNRSRSTAASGSSSSDDAEGEPEEDSAFLDDTEVEMNIDNEAEDSSSRRSERFNVDEYGEDLNIQRQAIENRFEAERRQGAGEEEGARPLFDMSADLQRGTFHFSGVGDGRNGNGNGSGSLSMEERSISRNSGKSTRKRASITHVRVPSSKGKPPVYTKRLPIGEYTYASGQTEIDFEQIEVDEMGFYEAEFRRLNVRTRELLRYLRKSPEFMERGYLRSMYEAALRGHTLEEEKNTLREEEAHAVLADSPTNLTPEARHQNAIERAEKAVMSVKRFNDTADDPKHLLIMAKRRVTLAYKRVEMAMHRLEMESKVPPRSPTMDGGRDGTTQTNSYVPFSTSDTALDKQGGAGGVSDEEGERGGVVGVGIVRVGAAADTTPAISRIPSDTDALGVSPLTVASDDGSSRQSPQPQPPTATSGAVLPTPLSASTTAKEVEGTTPSTVRTHLPSGNTPLPDDAGSPDTRMTPPPPPSEG